MIRHATAALLALCLSPAWLHAQNAVLTVNVASANVHQSPSTGSPIVGTAPRGTALVVTHELGSWVKVSWPKEQNGIGYVHIKSGTLAHTAVRVDAPAQTPRSATIGTPTAQIPPPPPTARVEPRPAAAPAPPAATTTTHRVSHVFAVGGFTGRLSGPNVGYGASGRVWRNDRFGFQATASRYGVDAADASGRVTSLQFQPSVLYSVRDTVTDYLWLRPYVGSGVNLRRQTWTATAPGFVDTLSENRIGFQVLGGSEFSVASAPQFAVSADLAYNWSRGPFAGVKIGGLGFTLAGHWYLK